MVLDALFVLGIGVHGTIEGYKDDEE